MSSVEYGFSTLPTMKLLGISSISIINKHIWDGLLGQRVADNR